jgi:hypothetical protein
MLPSRSIISVQEPGLGLFVPSAPRPALVQSGIFLDLFSVHRLRLVQQVNRFAQRVDVFGLAIQFPVFGMGETAGLPAQLF